MGKTTLLLDGIYAHDDRAQVEKVSLDLHQGECVAFYVSDWPTRRLLAGTLTGVFPASGGRIEINQRDMSDETMFARLENGLAIILPKERGRNLFPNDRLMQESFLGYRKTVRKSNFDGLPWLGNKKSYRSFKRDYDVYTSGTKRPSVILVTDFEVNPSTEHEHLFYYSMKRFLDEGGSLLAFTDRMEAFKGAIDRIGVINHGRLIGLVENQSKFRESLECIGGLNRDV